MAADPTTVAAPRRGRRHYSQLSRGDKIALTIMVGIPTLVHFAFVWVPTLATILLSVTDWDGIAPVSQINVVGLRNYWEIFTIFEDDLLRALVNNGILLVFLFLLPTAFGILLAYLLDKSIRGTSLYQSLYYYPVVLSLAVVGFIWKSTIYSPSQGLLSTVLGRTTPGDQVDWLGDQTQLFTFHLFGADYGLTKNFAAILVAIAWRHAGYIMVLYLAGLKSVDPSLREAASIDGCSEWQSFRRVIFPAMKPINIVVLVITVIEGLRAFDIVFALKQPRGMELLSLLVTDNIVGEGGGNVGRGSGYGVIQLVLCLGFIIWFVANSYREER